MIKRFRKRPVVIEAIQFTGSNIREVYEFVHGPRWIGEPSSRTLDWWERYVDTVIARRHFEINTLEGTMSAAHGDFIIKGVNGEFYPCKPDIFYKTYEPE